jgi:hypothetical protein
MKVVKDVTADSIICSNIEVLSKVSEVTHISLGTTIPYTTNQSTKIPFNLNSINCIMIDPTVDMIPAPVSMTIDLTNNQININQGGIYTINYHLTVTNTLLLGSGFSGIPEEYDVWVNLIGSNVIQGVYVAEGEATGSFLLTGEGLSNPDVVLTISESWTGYIPSNTIVDVMMYISTQSPGTETLFGLDGEGSDRTYLEVIKLA